MEVALDIDLDSMKYNCTLFFGSAYKRIWIAKILCMAFSNQDKFRAQLSLGWKKFYNLGAWSFFLLLTQSHSVDSGEPPIHSEFWLDLVSPVPYTAPPTVQLSYGGVPYPGYEAGKEKMSLCMKFPTMWYFDMCRLRGSSAASF